MPSTWIETGLQNYGGTTLNIDVLKGELYVVNPFQK